MPCLLWNPKVHYSVHKILPLIPTLSQMQPFHNSPPYFPKIHSNIFPSTRKSSKWYLPFRFSNKNTACIFRLYHACYIPLPISFSLFEHPNKLRSSSLCKLLQPPASSSLSGSNIPLSTLFSNTVFFPQCERPSFTPTHKAWFASCIKPNKRQQYSGYGFVVFRLREHTIN